MNWGAVGNNEGLTVYQKALQFVMTMYGVCSALPTPEKPHLEPLIKKAATGITTHISEAGRKAAATDKIRSLKTAAGYLEECGYYLDNVETQGYMDTASVRTELKQLSDLLQTYMDDL